MTKTKTTMSALALAAAAFATTTLLAGGASATPALTGATPSQHIPVTQAFPKPPGLVNHIPVNQVFPKPPHPVLGIPVLPKPPHPVLGIPVNPGMGKGGSSGGSVVSCHPGTGCTVTGGDRDHDHDHDHDSDRDHDHDYDRDHDHDRWFKHWGYWYPRWSLPPVYTDYVVSPVESCTYEYKWESTYVPGFGLRRAMVKVCTP
jgi:hypothetical protein